jgi:hypothetical protein
VLDIVDESTMHAEHAAMRDHGYNETHFKYPHPLSIIIIIILYTGPLG